MTSRTQPGSISAAMVLFLLVSSSALAAGGNVVLFVVDDQGRDAGCYGNKAISTPGLDRLATDGTRFDYAFCTTASCSASRSVLLTGLHNHVNGQYGHQHSYHNFHTRTSVQSLPVLLGRAGYRTARIGKYHVQPESVYQFDAHLRGNQGGSRNAVAMAERCRSWITQDSDKPFFLYFATSDPHRSGRRADHPLTRPDPFGNGRKYDGVVEKRFKPEDVIVPPYLPDTIECRREIAEYYQSVHRLDQGLGRLLDILQESGHWKNTLFLYLSDNGIAFPGAKTTLYEPGMRLPLVARSPDQKKRGIATDAMVSWTDITPTILDFAGATPESYKFNGRSFLGVLDQETTRGWDEIYASHTFHEITMYYPMRVVRTRRHKYILNIAHGLTYPHASDLWASAAWQGVWQRKERYYGRRTVEAYLKRPKHELYDLERDAHEVINVAGNPDYAKTLEEMQAKLAAFQNLTKDPWRYKRVYE